MWRVWLLVLLMLGCPDARSATLLNTHPVTPGGQNYKDSFYFAWGGGRYLAVSDLSRGGISLLKDVGNDDNYSQLVKNFPVSGAYAPQVYFTGTNDLVLFFTVIPGDFQQARIRYLKYNMSTGRRSTVKDFPFVNPADNVGLIDPTVWYEPGLGHYLVAARVDSGPFGLHLVWAWADSLLGAYTTPLDLTDQYGGQVDQWRTDIGNITEAPIWSYWDHDGDGAHELYWSIGPSDPYTSGGACFWEVQAVRRGNIRYYLGVPWIDVIGYYGGPDDFMGYNEDCYLLTHPDFTASGDIRATGHRGGSGGTFTIVQP